jgi:hypothetical protein
MRRERFAQPIGRKVPVGAFREHDSIQNTRIHSWYSSIHKTQSCRAGKNVVNDTLQGTLYNYSNSSVASNRAQVPKGTFYKYTLYEPMHPSPAPMPESAKLFRSDRFSSPITLQGKTLSHF